MFPKLFLIISIVSLLFFTDCYSNHQCVDHQKSLLLQLKNELIFGPSFSTKLVRWNQKDDCCKWYGVECDGAGNIISLQLDDEAISGGIGDSSSLFRLEYLEKLNLAENKFNSTPFPRGIHNLTYLTHLNLSNAGFDGQVPAQLSSLRRLVSLDISSNIFWHLKLEYPNLEMLLSNLTGLTELYLDGVNITSSHERRKWSHIISSYLPNLANLSLRNCDLSGPLAKSFWQLHSLSILQLGGNDLSATNPDLFANLTTLRLVDCELKGYFPEMIFHLPTLQNIELSFNEQLSGSIPSFTQTGYSIKSISLSTTNFTGSLPSSIGNLKTLSEINLSYSRFTGSIPSSFANLTQLVLVDFSGNFFTGSLSSSMFGGLSNLVYLYLGENSFSGSIPHSFFCLPSLQVLSLPGNMFNGTFQLDNIPVSLQVLDLDSNQLRDNLNLLLPANIGNVLQVLLLADNSFSGSIPTSLCNATNLRVIDFYINRLSGNIPSCLIENSSNLNVLDLGLNNISGLIPDHFPINCNLRYLDLNNNNLQGKIPILREFGVHECWWEHDGRHFPMHVAIELGCSCFALQQIPWRSQMSNELARSSNS